jgi:hypothetical protein
MPWIPRDELVQLRAAEAERTKLRAELEQLHQRARDTPPERPRVINVRELLPTTCDADPAAPTAGNVRLAFRSHVLFRNAARCSLDWADIVRADVDNETRLALLCEYYARAIYEAAFVAHFDATQLRTCDRKHRRHLRGSRRVRRARACRVPGLRASRIPARAPGRATRSPKRLALSQDRQLQSNL